MKESIIKTEEQGHSHKHALAVWALAIALLTWCDSHFPNDMFLMNVEDRSGTINFKYNHGKNGDELHYDIIVKEDGDSWYVAYVTVGPAYGNRRTYSIKAKDMNELKSKLEYDLVIARSEDIFLETQQNTQNKIISFTEAYNSFLRDSEPTFIEIREQKLRLNDIKSEIQELKKNKTEHNKEMIRGLQQEKRYIERRLKELGKPVEVPYNKDTHSTWN